MIQFWILIGSLWLLATILLWWHYFRSKKLQPAELSDERKHANIALYEQQLAELKQDLDSGAIEEASFTQLKLELDKTLIQDVESDKAERASEKGMSIFWPLGLTLFISGFSFYFYLSQGSYLAYEQAKNNPVNDAAVDQRQQELARIQQLETIVQADPQNSRAWYSLAQSHVMLGNYDKALDAYDKVIAVEGDVADIYGSKAQTLYYKNGQQITPAVQSMIDKALALDPLDSSTLVLLGMHNYLGQNFQKAIEYWQKVVDSNRPNVNSAALTQAINEAKSLMTGVGQTAVADGGADSGYEGPMLPLIVSLSEEVIAKLSEGEDKAVFIYATAANGGRMPLAATKLMASDLPVEITLTNQNAMSPQANLASAEKINIYAVISQSGTPGIQTGDFIAEVLDVPNHSDVLIDVLIATEVE